MEKLTLLGVLGLLCLGSNTYAQSFAYNLNHIKEPLYVGDYIKRTIPLGSFINYKSKTATLNDFPDIRCRIFFCGF